MEKDPKNYNVVITKELPYGLWYVYCAKFMTEVEVIPVLEALGGPLPEAHNEGET